MTAYEQLMALKASKANTTDTTNDKQGIVSHKVLGVAVHTAAQTGERLITTAKFMSEIWQAGRLSVREEVAADIMAIINRK